MRKRNNPNNYDTEECAMALIKCPECGQEISDKATRCIHCGIDLKSTQIQTKICAECGKENSVDATECIYCGCPFEEKEESPIVEVREPISVQKVLHGIRRV